MLQVIYWLLIKEKLVTLVRFEVVQLFVDFNTLFFVSQSLNSDRHMVVGALQMYWYLLNLFFKYLIYLILR